MTAVMSSTKHLIFEQRRPARMRPVQVFPLLLILVVLLGACGCTGTSPTPPATTEASPAVTAPPVTTTITPLTVETPPETVSVSDNTILIRKNTFSPANITVKIGSTVRWVNYDDHPHRIEFADKGFTTSTFLLGSSQSASQRFDRPGKFDYSCMIHPEMQGQVEVVA